MFIVFWKSITALGTFFSSFFLLAIRLYWGYQFILTGTGKLLHINATTAYFSSLGIPFPYANTLLVGNIEFLGGCLLLLGLFSRIAVIPLFFVLSVAYLTAGHKALSTLFLEHNPSLFFSDDAFLFLYAVLIVFCFGPGKISFDYRITGANKKKIIP